MTGAVEARSTRPRALAMAIPVIASLLSACHAGRLEPELTHPAGVIAASPRLGERPYGVAISRTGIVFVSRLDAEAISRADLPDTTFTGFVAVGLVPTDVVFNRAATRAFVANQHSQQVGIVDVATSRQVDALDFPGDPARVLVAPDDRTLFVATNTGRLYRVDLATKDVVAEFELPELANGLVLNSGGTRLYASTISGAVVEIHTGTNAVLRTFPVGRRAQGLAVSPDGREVYIADETDRRMIVWSLTEGRFLQAVPLSGRPFDLRLTPDGAQIYVSLYTTGQVLVFDRASRERVATIPTGGDPRRIAFDPTGSVAVVANQAGWVDFIR